MSRCARLTEASLMGVVTDCADHAAVGKLADKESAFATLRSRKDATLSRQAPLDRGGR